MKPKILSLLDDKIINYTLLAANWVDGIYTYENKLIKSSKQIIEMLPSENITREQYDALLGSKIIGTEQKLGSINLKSLGNMPEIDIPVTFIIRGDV